MHTLLALSTLAGFGPVPPTPVPKARVGHLMGVIPGQKKLTFDKAGNFKVVSFSDMHFGERWGNGSWADWGTEQDVNTTIVHGTILDEEQPDYVVFNGDLVTGENVFASNATGYLDQCFGPTVQRGIPFSSTQGNHDNADNITHLEEIEYERAHYGARGSYTRADAGPRPFGCGNYWVPVYAREGDSAPALVMWFLDSQSFTSGSGGGDVPEGADYYWVEEESVPAYVDAQAEAMRAAWGALPPSLVFVHIPFQKSAILSTLPSAGDHDDEPDPSTQGFLPNNSTYTGRDLPAFRAVVRLAEGRGTVLAVTSGHDHGESWCARSADSGGVVLCFDGHSGYGGYVTPNSAVRNGRVFGLSLGELRAEEGPSVRSWNSYENRTRNDHVVLGPGFMTQDL